jgi:CheY-like chemotaxis protein
LAKLQHHPEIALVVIDVHMPGEPEGLALVDIATRENPKIRMVVISGKAYLQDDDILGGGRFLSKPYSRDQMMQTVQQMLA